MKRSKQQTDDFMALARSRKKQADDADQKQLARELDDLKFLVDPWPSDIRTSRKGQDGSSDGTPPIPARPCLFIDTLRDPIAHIAAEAQQTDLGPELTPADDFSELVGPIDPTEIELREGLIRKVQRESDARSARNWAADRARKAGRGYYLVLTRYVSRRSRDQEVYVGGIYNQSSVRLDPSHEQSDGSDVDWEFWGTDMPWLAYQAEFPDRASKVHGAQSVHGNADAEWRGLGDEAPDWFFGEGDTRFVRVMNYVYTEREAVTLVELLDGRMVPKAEALDPSQIAKDADGEPITRRDVKKTIYWAKIDGVNLLEETEWPSEHMPIVKVVWEEVQPFDKERRTQGIVRPARDPAFGVCVMATTEVEVALMAPKTPVIGHAGAFEGFESAWDASNVRNIGRLEYNPEHEKFPGTPMPPPGPLVRNSDISVWDGLRQMFLQSVKGATGIPDATLGNVDPSVRSGRAVRQLIEQAQQGLSGGLANLAKSVTYEAKIVNSLLYPIYGTRPGRLLQMMTGKHESQGVMVGTTSNPSMGVAASPRPFVRDDKQRPVPFDPQQHAGQDPQQYYLTPDADFNVAIRISKDYDTRRQEEASTLGALLEQSPELMTWFGDLYFENQDGPGHKDMAERAKLMLAPPIQAKLSGSPQVPPQIQAQLAQQGQELQKAQQFIATKQAEQQGMLQKAQMDGQIEMQKAQLQSQTQLEIAKIKAQSDLVSSELKAQTAEQALRIRELESMVLSAKEQRIEAASHVHDVGLTAMTHLHEQQMAAQTQAHQAQMATQAQTHQAAQQDGAQQHAADSQQTEIAASQQAQESQQEAAAQAAQQQGGPNE